QRVLPVAPGRGRPLLLRPPRLVRTLGQRILRRRHHLPVPRLRRHRRGPHRTRLRTLRRHRRRRRLHLPPLRRHRRGHRVPRLRRGGLGRLRPRLLLRPVGRRAGRLLPGTRQGCPRRRPRTRRRVRGRPGRRRLRRRTPRRPHPHRGAAHLVRLRHQAPPQGGLDHQPPRLRPDRRSRLHHRPRRHLLRFSWLNSTPAFASC